MVLLFQVVLHIHWYYFWNYSWNYVSVRKDLSQRSQSAENTGFPGRISDYETNTDCLSAVAVTLVIPTLHAGTWVGWRRDLTLEETVICRVAPAVVTAQSVFVVYPAAIADSYIHFLLEESGFHMGFLVGKPGSHSGFPLVKAGFHTVFLLGNFGLQTGFLLAMIDYHKFGFPSVKADPHKFGFPSVKVDPHKVGFP